MEKSNTNKIFEVQSKNCEKFGFREEDLPSLKEKELVIKVKYVPLIHYDLMKMSGVTGASFPYTPCVECSGVVEDAHNKELIGKKVAFLSLKFGVLQSRLLVSEEECLFLNDDACLKIASQNCCNPYTASGIVDTAIEMKAKVFALTAANSAVGKIINRIAKDKGLEVINIVRSEKRQKEMEEEGFSNVINSSDNDFVSNLNRIMTEKQSNLLFDTLAGPIVGVLMKALPKNSCLINFGTQTHEPYSGIDATDMRWGNKEMKNFLCGTWVDNKIKEGTFESHKKYIADNQEIFKSELGKIYDWKNMKEAVDFSNNTTSNAKTIIEVTE